jgi:hypothetical protein
MLPRPFSTSVHFFVILSVTLLGCNAKNDEKMEQCVATQISQFKARFPSIASLEVWRAAIQNLDGALIIQANNGVSPKTAPCIVSVWQAT